MCKLFCCYHKLLDLSLNEGNDFQFFQKAIKEDHTTYYEEIFGRVLSKIINHIVFNDKIVHNKKFEIVNELQALIRKIGQRKKSAINMLNKMTDDVLYHVNFISGRKFRQLRQAIDDLRDLLNYFLNYKFSDINTKCGGYLIKMIKNMICQNKLKKDILNLSKVRF